MSDYIWSRIDTVPDYQDYTVYNIKTYMLTASWILMNYYNIIYIFMYLLWFYVYWFPGKWLRVEPVNRISGTKSVLKLLQIHKLITILYFNW